MTIDILLDVRVVNGVSIVGVNEAEVDMMSVGVVRKRTV